MTANGKQPDSEPSRMRRAAGFFARRARIDKAFDASRRGADFLSDLAFRLRPRRFDRKGLSGRYDDGGVARFRDMAQSMSKTALERQLRGWELQRSCFQYAALIAILMIPVGLVFWGISRILVVGLAALFLFAIFRAVRADYFAWIIEQGRFGGFYDYMTSRLPRNMHVIIPNDHRSPPADLDQ